MTSKKDKTNEEKDIQLIKDTVYYVSSSIDLENSIKEVYIDNDLTPSQDLDVSYDKEVDGAQVQGEDVYVVTYKLVPVKIGKLKFSPITIYEQEVQ